MFKFNIFEKTDTRESNIKEKSHFVFSIVDAEKFPEEMEGLEKSKVFKQVTPENINKIIDETLVHQAEMRKSRDNNFPENMKPSDVLKEMSDRSSKCHMILCSLNTTQDFGDLKNHLSKYIAENEFSPDKEKKFKEITNFTDRHIRMSELLTQCYIIDAKRRMGGLKNDKRFWEQGFSDFKKMEKIIEESLNQYESANEEYIKKSTEAQMAISALRKELKEGSPESLRDYFYQGICQNYSELIVEDFEDFHEEMLQNSIKEMEK